jgi:hypothetical protein
MLSIDKALTEQLVEDSMGAAEVMGLDVFDCVRSPSNMLERFRCSNLGSTTTTIEQSSLDIPIPHAGIFHHREPLRRSSQQECSLVLRNLSVQNYALEKLEMLRWLSLRNTQLVVSY